MSWRRILLLSIALVAILGTVTWSLLQHSDIATNLVKKQLSELFRVRADVAATRLELGAGRLELTGFALADPTQPERNLVQIEKGHVDVEAGSGFQAEHVVIEGLRVECGPEWPNPDDLLQEQKGSGDGSAIDVPVVDVLSGTAAVHLCAEERPLELEAIKVTMTPRTGQPSLLQVRGSLQLREPAAELSVLGEVDIASGAAQLSLTTTGIECNADVVAYLARLAKVDRQSLELDGTIESLTLLVRVPGKTVEDRTPTLQLSATCQQLRVRHPELPPLVEQATLKVFVDTSGNGMVQASVHQQNRSGEIHVDTTIKNFADPDFDVRAKGRDVVLDSDVLAALQTFPLGKQLVAAIRPTTGHGDIDLYLRNPHRPNSQTELELTMRDVAMSFAGFGAPESRIGFPLPLIEAQGRVKLRNGVLLFENVSASIPASSGGGKVTMIGRIDTDKRAGENTNLTIVGDDVAFGPDLRSALATLLKDDGDLYDKLSPEGLAHVQVQVRPFSELSGGYRVEVEPTGAAMKWQGFPYKLQDLRGNILVENEGVQFDLTGRHGSGGLTMVGRIPLRTPHAAEDGFEAVIDLEKLSLDEDLREAITVVVPELAPHWRKAEPTGPISGQVKVWRPQPEDALQHDVRLALEGVDLKLPVAPWRATGLTGQVVVQGAGPRARIDFDALRGQLENGQERPAQLALLGHVEASETPNRDLAFVVRDLELCPQLGKSLDELGALDFATWHSLQPSGRVDLVIRERAGDDIIDQQDLQVVVQLVDVRSEAPMLPGPAEHMTGELRIQNGELTFRDVRGEIKGALVQGWEGSVRHLDGDAARTEIGFAVRSKGFPVDDDLANLFTGPLRRTLIERQLRGSADVDGLKLTFVIPDPNSSQPFTTTLQGHVTLDDITMVLGNGDDGIRIHDLRGDVLLAKSTVSDEGGQLKGTLRGGSLTLFGHPFEAIGSGFTADAERLVMTNLQSTVHGGRLRYARPDAPALTYVLPSEATPDGLLAADLEFVRVDVFSLLEQSGWQNAPYSGAASGKVTLRRLEGNDVVGAEAEGTLQIDDADLGEVPLFKAINAQLPPSERPRFDSLSARYQLGGEQLEFENLEVRSDLLNVRGDGKLALDGYLDVVMSVENPGGVWRDPIFMPLIGEFVGSLVRVHLFGHLRDLQTDPRLSIDSSPGRRPVLPLPPHRPTPTAPGF